MEIWKIVPNTNEMYKASNYGNFLSFKYGDWRKIKSNKNKHGYLYIDLYVNKKRNNLKAHRIIAELFLIKENVLYNTVNHKDGNKANNHIDNLEWCSNSQNIQHAYDTGLKPILRGDKHGRSKLTQEIANKIKVEIKSGNYTQVGIGKKYGVSRSAIQRLLYGKAWN